MGKKKSKSKSKDPTREIEPLFSPIKTTDDDDDDDVEQHASSSGPATRYHDDPQASNDDGGPTAAQFRDDPGSIFDWDIGAAATSGDDDKKDEEESDEEDDEDGTVGVGTVYDIDGYDGGGFTPVSLHDTDSEGGDSEGGNNNGADFDGNGGESPHDQKIRRKANKLLNERLTYDNDDDDGDDAERLFVGGGWGRHGSQFSARGCCSCTKMKEMFCGPKKQKGYSYGPPSEGGATCRLVCLSVVFLGLVISAGFLGYDAGLPVNESKYVNIDGEDQNITSDNATAHHHAHVKGEEWMEATKDWVQHEKDELHHLHWNFTLHHKHSGKDKQDDNAAFRTSEFSPMTQGDLLALSESVFQSCSERSLQTIQGRQKCAGLCHGRYCCFEKELIYGSCVSQENSYCFAYAACENAIVDFGMNNANSAKESQGGAIPVLDGNDIKLLGETCSKDNIATLGGIRDCNAFCQHHLCCFNTLESENCKEDHLGECQAYAACSILVEGPDDDAGKTVEAPAKAPAVVVDKKNTPVVEHDFKKDCVGEILKQNWDVCKNHCSRYECCFHNGEECTGFYDANKLECEEYSNCGEFFQTDDEDFTSVDSAVDGDDPGAPGVYDYTSADVNKDIETAVHAVCGLEDESPGNDGWVAACHALCADHLCCFSQSEKSNCRAESGEESCAPYEGCIVLHSEEPGTEGERVVDGGPSTGVGFGATDEEKQAEIDAVVQSCTPKARRDPRAAENCRNACQTRSCCFDVGPGGCANMNENWCEEFSACDVIYT